MWHVVQPRGCGLFLDFVRLAVSEFEVFGASVVLVVDDSRVLMNGSSRLAMIA